MFLFHRRGVPGSAGDWLLAGETERPGRVLTGEMSRHIAIETAVPILTLHISHDSTVDEGKG